MLFGLFRFDSASLHAVWWSLPPILSLINLHIVSHLTTVSEVVLLVWLVWHNCRRLLELM